jgi:hypothetical protein
MPNMSFLFFSFLANSFFSQQAMGILGFYNNFLFDFRPIEPYQKIFFQLKCRGYWSKTGRAGLIVITPEKIKIPQKKFLGLFFHIR